MSSDKPRRLPHRNKRTSSRKYPTYLIHDPPTDLPDELKFVYKLAARPHLVMENLCVQYEREMARDSLTEFSHWARGLREEWRKLRRWLNEHEGKLRAEAEDVRLALDAMHQTLAAAVSEISYAMTMLTGTPLDPDDAYLHGLAQRLERDSGLQADAKKLRDKDAKRIRFLKDCTLSKARKSRIILERLRAALSAWAPPIGWNAAEYREETGATQGTAATGEQQVEAGGLPLLPRCAEPILETMLAMRAFSQDAATTRPAVVERINPKRKVGSYRRGFDRLKKLQYTDGAPGREVGGIWLTSAGRARAEEVKRRNDSTAE